MLTRIRKWFKGGNVEEKPEVEETPPPRFYDQFAEAHRNNLQEEVKRIFKGTLLERIKSTPLSTLDGKPNPMWVAVYKLGYPDLLEEEILAKQRELIDAEVAIIDAFLNKEDSPVDNTWAEDLEPEVKLDDLGYWYIKIHKQWVPIANGDMPSVP